MKRVFIMLAIVLGSAGLLFAQKSNQKERYAIAHALPPMPLCQPQSVARRDTPSGAAASLRNAPHDKERKAIPTLYEKPFFLLGRYVARNSLQQQAICSIPQRFWKYKHFAVCGEKLVRAPPRCFTVRRRCATLLRAPRRGRRMSHGPMQPVSPAVQRHARS